MNRSRFASRVRFAHSNLSLGPVILVVGQQKFSLDVPGPNDYEIDGSFWQHEFEFTRSGRRVASVSKEYWKWTDSYGVNIVDGEDDVSILCACIVIDQVLHDGDRN